MSTLTDREITAALESGLPEWRRDGDALVRAVIADDFPTGIALVDRVAVAAEAAEHHPDIDIRWTSITFRLSTHSQGGITTADINLAREIDALI